MNSSEHIQRYRALMAARTATDPKEAVGGLWEQIGEWQFELMRSQGLQPWHFLLDLGCGSFRGGRHFIRYLEPMHYVGIDISRDIIVSGLAMLAQEGVNPSWFEYFITSTTSLPELAGRKFDYALAQSVLTHSPTHTCEELFASVSALLAPNAKFVFTYFDGPHAEFLEAACYRHPLSFFEKLSAGNGLAFADLRYKPSHPRGQSVAIATKP